ncbi:response regulator transcription factor [Phycicoccus sp. MAQZ13P-2]|uniref:response regulator transcription factor n=1 Tax=Phycicoccus mangrovi TaxID=2840470 RepID=UPI001C0009D2|nr:response regulator transcription factor [Phycicoccus mangrovi]MBT9254055.1 response regulator transcription factor [Phycicoccus mangrovi]MBT9275532.1 response regulator transcription factor [Phycicoccus mangrovi]
MATARILLVEDDDAIREAVAVALRDEGYEVAARPDGASLEDHLEAFRPDLVVLDWMLPGRDGPTLARVARRFGDVGVVMLTARDGVSSRLRGFDSGVDDYVTKPFAMAELLARLRALLRRLGRVPSTVEVGDLVVDLDGAVVTRAGHRIDLTATELRLLGFLVENRGRTMSTTQILTQVWGYEDVAENLVQVHVSALRKKLEAHGDRLVHTVRGIGYVVRA